MIALMTPQWLRPPNLNGGDRVALLIGQGARGCGQELIDVADILGAGVAKALLGKDVLPILALGHWLDRAVGYPRATA